MSPLSFEERAYDTMIQGTDVCPECGERKWFEDWDEEMCKECKQQEAEEDEE